MNVNNAVEILARSYQINCMDLKKSAFKFIKRNKGKIEENESCHEVFLQALGSMFLKPKSTSKHERQQDSRPKPFNSSRTLRNTKGL